jgi:hypothetical protein
MYAESAMPQRAWSGKNKQRELNLVVESHLNQSFDDDESGKGKYPFPLLRYKAKPNSEPNC